MKAVLTVSEVNNIIKNLLDSNEILRQVYIRGEISNFKHHNMSGHMYFTLKDEKSQIRCVMFKNSNMLLPFLPENGMNVIAFGFISVFTRDGQYQLYVEDLQPDGIGALHIAFEKLKARLEKEGLFSPERKQMIPFLPKKIGLVTSPTGAAIRDLLTVIKRRFPNIDIIIAPVLVQGKGAADEICSAISHLNSLKNVDVIIVGRGGGSIEELWAFNEEKVARAIADSKIPVISAVGHETDYTIADFVADKRAPTPSAAGEIAVPEKRMLKNEVRHVSLRLVNGFYNYIGERRQKLEYLKTAPVFKRPQTYIINYRLIIDELLRRLKKDTNYFMTKQRSLLNHNISRLEALNPLAILKRGYSICIKNNTTHVVKELADVKKGDFVRVILSDGSLICNVKECEKKGDVN
ncbi:MAG: exodeoxyribonuclease VII large subunit [Thermoanaerobacteraceae bacterium]|nr:exodeoxyribonuclease VII large subunit [Thermoanaerobacteraceae bacterium]